jgi:hypothetical protein
MIGIRYNVYNDLNLVEVVDRLILFLTRQKMPNLKSQKNCFFSFEKVTFWLLFGTFVVRSIVNSNSISRWETLH